MHRKLSASTPSMQAALLPGLKVPGTVWVDPSLRAEVAYRGVTTAGELLARIVQGAGGVMTATIAMLDLEEFQMLTRMTTRSEPFVATIARATLAIVEARRDAETRAAMSELALEAAQERFAAIRAVITSTSGNGLDPTEALRQIASLAV